RPLPICRACRAARLRRPRAPLFPYTTLFRSRRSPVGGDVDPDPQRAVLGRFRAGLEDVVPRIGGPGLRALARRRALGEAVARQRSEEHTSELQSRGHLVCRLLLEKNKTPQTT